MKKNHCCDGPVYLQYLGIWVMHEKHCNGKMNKALSKIKANKKLKSETKKK